MLGLAVVFYARGAQSMERELRERLRTAAAIGALSFSVQDVQQVQGRGDMDTEAFRRLVQGLNAVREQVPDVIYAYIMRRTGDPLTLEFVADADSPALSAQADDNGNGTIDPDEELSFPGDLYDISDAPVMQNEAFGHPAVDAEMTHDQWGAFISSYAPIVDGDGETVAILGLDMAADDYLQTSRSLFSGFSFTLFLMMAVLTAAFVVLFTWKHRLDSLREVDRERGALVGLALHQLGTPLSIFRWWVEILEDEYGDKICAETEACIQMEEGIDRLENVFNDLKEAHAVSQGKITFHTERASLQDIIRTEVAKLADRLARHRKRVKVDIPEDIVMNVDRKLIAGVVAELLENAITYSPEGSQITVSAIHRRRDAVVSVRDQGVGIPKKDLPNVFKKFVRGEGAHKYKPMGTGLGLFVARGIVEEAGGKIWVESKEGRGTTASFSLPLKKRWWQR